MTIGRYGNDGISLAPAREKCLEARRLVAEGQSPSREKQREKRRIKEARNFAEFGERWFKEAPMADSTRAMRRSIFDRDIVPAWKNRLLIEIMPDDLRALCAKVKGRGAPATAVHVRDIVKQIFGFAIMHGEKVRNPADEAGPASIATFAPKDRALSPTEIRIMPQQLEHVPTLPTIRLGLRLILFTMVRKSELLDAVWDEVFAAFAGVARHMPPDGKDEALALGYLFLLQRLLEHLRYRTDRGYDDVARLIAEFQADVVAQVAAGAVDGLMLALVGGALQQSRIPASPELTAASSKYASERGIPEGGPLPADIREALGGVIEQCGRDPFVVVSSLIESGHAAPVDTRGAVAAALALAGIPDARSAAVLFLLDPEPEVRSAVAGALDEAASALTPADVRRLIAVRNWRPESERTEVDAVIRKARAAGIACGQWDAGSAESILATIVDSAMAQGFLLVSPAGRKKRLSSVLTKGGIADAWSGGPETRRSIEACVAGAESPMQAVSRAYLDRAVAHHLALTIGKGDVPPPGLLQVAETIGGADWQPERMDFSKALAALIAEVPPAMREPAALVSALLRSGELADIEVVGQSWFEDDPEIAEAVTRARSRDREKLASYLLQTVIARRRDRWAEIVLRAALWMREAPPEKDLCWRELALVAQALADGRDMSEIGLMREVALRTIAAHQSAEPTLSERDRAELIRVLSLIQPAAGGRRR